MKILVDTNIMIDIFTRREPWFQDSYNALAAILQDGSHECLFSASAVTDIFYIVRKALGDKQKAKEIINKLSRLATVADVQPSDIYAALNSPMDDFEDALVDSVAKRHGATYILTRNTSDFELAKVQAITPTNYLSIVNS